MLMENKMDIIFQGRHNGDEASLSLQGVIQLLKERYHIEFFREMHLSLTLVDAVGEDVELVDSETSTPYRMIEVCRDYHEVSRRVGRPALKLVVDNAP
jgi:hypothetical protein